jgi:hypothetical protein
VGLSGIAPRQIRYDLSHHVITMAERRRLVRTEY